MVQLQLGWHVLRNPGSAERADPGFNRDKEESAFLDHTIPWSSITEESRGIDQLKFRLRDLLTNHVKEELPRVISTPEDAARLSDQILSQLGQARNTPSEHRTFLSAIANAFSRLVRQSMDGSYSEGHFFKDESMNLRARVKILGEKYARRMRESGHRFALEMAPFKSGVKENVVHTVDLRDTTPCTAPKVAAREVYLKAVADLLRQNQGPELFGNYNSRIVDKLFKSQSSNWSLLTEYFTAEVVSETRRILMAAVKYTAGLERAELLLTHVIFPAADSRCQSLDIKVKELLAPYQKKHPITLSGSRGRIPIFGIGLYFNLSAEEKSKCPHKSKAMEEQKAYYEVAQDVFLDNVATLAVEMCLLDGLEEVFSPMSLIQMSDEQVKLLGSESPRDSKKRQTEQAKLTALKAGLEHLRTFTPVAYAVPSGASDPAVHQPQPSSPALTAPVRQGTGLELSQQLKDLKLNSPVAKHTSSGALIPTLEVVHPQGSNKVFDGTGMHTPPKTPMPKSTENKSPLGTAFATPATPTSIFASTSLTQVATPSLASTPSAPASASGLGSTTSIPLRSISFGSGNSILPPVLPAPWPGSGLFGSSPAPDHSRPGQSISSQPEIVRSKSDQSLFSQSQSSQSSPFAQPKSFSYKPNIFARPNTGPSSSG